MPSDHPTSEPAPLLALGSVLAIREGECWGVVGGNGSGKSSLALALAGEGGFRGVRRESSLDKVICVSFEDEQSLLE